MRRRFGQHFLRAPAVIDAIITAIAPRADEQFVEIGPGDGALTDVLLATGARICAVEIDRQLAATLRKRHADRPNFQLINADILKTDWTLLNEGEPFRLVGNLPYNISTPLLLQIAAIHRRLRDGHIMVQREVGKRLAAAPGDSDYGRLTVSVRQTLATRYLFDVAPDAFAPPPKVDSSVLQLTPQPSPPPPPPKFEEVLRAAFQQRRKTLKNALSAMAVDWDSCPIDGARRAQELSPEDYRTLAAHIGESDRMTP